MDNVRFVPITVIRVDDRGTPETTDDVLVHETHYRIEVYADGIDPNIQTDAVPTAVYASEDDQLDLDGPDADLELLGVGRTDAGATEVGPEAEEAIARAIAAHLGLEPDRPEVSAFAAELLCDPKRLEAFAALAVDGALAEETAGTFVDALELSAYRPLFASLLAEAYPGGDDFDEGTFSVLVENMPSQVAGGLTEALEAGNVDMELVMPLLRAASGGDPNERARAAAALFGIAFEHLDQDGEAWTAITGFDFLAEFGGNCANFLSVGYLYSGFERFGELTVADGPMTFRGPPVPDGSARGAFELQRMFQSRGAVVTDPLELRFGDIVYSSGDPHVSMVVGFGPPSRATGPAFATLEDARAHYGAEAELTPYVVDHDPGNPGAGPRPMQQVFSGGDWTWVNIGNPVGP